MANTTSTSTSSLFTTPIHGQPQPAISILLINPNSTPSMTSACVNTLIPSLPPNCTLTGFTAPHPSPSAIESATDAILSSEACIRALASPANAAATATFSAMLVACFSAHPLIPALREMYACPVIGIMEASLYASRMLGGSFGIVATGARSKLMQRDAVASYGLTGFYAGSEAVGMGVLELETKGQEETLGRVGKAARVLVEEKGADSVLLGCAGMTHMTKACDEAVGQEDGEGERVNVIDGVEIGVHLLIALVQGRLSTAKRGVYRSINEGRKAREQDWL